MSSKVQRPPAISTAKPRGGRRTPAASTGGRSTGRSGRRAQSRRRPVGGPASFVGTPSGTPAGTPSSPENGVQRRKTVAFSGAASEGGRRDDPAPRRVVSQMHTRRGADRGRRSPVKRLEANAGDEKGEDADARQPLDRQMSLAERNRQKALKAQAERAAQSKHRQRRRKVSRFSRFRRKYLSCGSGGNLDDVPISEEALAACERVYLQPEHIRRIKNTFDTIDIDGSGEIDRTELFEYIEETRSQFSEGIFLLGGPEVANKLLVSFSDFLLIVVTYCMYGKDDILRFTFNLFDVDGSGALDEDEFIQLAHVVNNKTPTFPGNFARALEEFDTNDDGMIDFEEFQGVNKRFPLVLFPAFKLQDSLRKKTLGLRGWTTVAANVARINSLLEYQANHDGALPTETSGRKFRRMMLSRFVYDPDPVRLIAIHEAAVARREAVRAAFGDMAERVEEETNVATPINAASDKDSPMAASASSRRSKSRYR